LTFALALSSGVVLAVAGGCAPGEWKRSETILSEPGLVVQIEEFAAREGAAGIGFSHPATVPASDLEGLLRATAYSRKADGHGARVMPLFPRDRTGEIAQAISEGFRAASSSERVRFSITFKGEESGPWFVPDEHRTRGTAFVRPEGTLNIAFDIVDEVVDQRRGAGKDPTDRSGSRVRLVLPEDARHHVTAAGERRPLWLTWEIPGAAPVKPISLQEDPKAQDPAPQAPGQGAEGETLIRLRQLEELHRDGALSDEEFERRRRLLLFGDEVPEEKPEEDPDRDPAMGSSTQDGLSSEPSANEAR
jgi:hypothetical protein